MFVLKKRAVTQLRELPRARPGLKDHARLQTRQSGRGQAYSEGSELIRGASLSYFEEPRQVVDYDPLRAVIVTLGSGLLLTPFTL